MLLLLAFYSSSWSQYFGQQAEFYIGTGVTNSYSKTFDNVFGVGYKIGAAYRNQLKRHPQRIGGFQIEYEQFFKQNYTPDPYVKSSRDIKVLNIIGMFHLPLLTKEKYKLFFGLGPSLALITNDTNLLIRLGANLGIRQQINISEEWAISIDLISSNQMDMVILFYSGKPLMYFTELLQFGIIYRF